MNTKFNLNADHICVITREIELAVPYDNLVVGDTVYITGLEIEYMFGMNGKTMTQTICAVVRDFNSEVAFGMTEWIPSDAIEVIGEL